MQRAQPSPDTLAQASFICRRAGGCRRWADHTFGYFHLATQEKVTRRKGERGGIIQRIALENKSVPFLAVPFLAESGWL
jgi:hypothetical protein